MGGSRTPAATQTLCDRSGQLEVNTAIKKNKKDLKTLWPLFMDGVQLFQG